MSGGGLEKESASGEHGNLKFEIKLKRKGNVEPCHYLAKLPSTFMAATEPWNGRVKTGSVSTCRQ